MPSTCSAAGAAFDGVQRHAKRARQPPQRIRVHHQRDTDILHLPAAFFYLRADDDDPRTARRGAERLVPRGGGVSCRDREGALSGAPSAASCPPRAGRRRRSRLAVDGRLRRCARQRPRARSARARPALAPVMTAWISATIASATCSGARPPRSRPAGPRRRARIAASSASPCSARSASSRSRRTVGPRSPTYGAAVGSSAASQARSSR